MANNVLGVGYTLSYENDYGFRTLGGRLDEAERLGMDFVEIPLWSMDLIAAAKVLPDRLKTVKSMLSGRSLRYTVHGSLAINFMDVPERLERHREVLRASLDVSAELEGLHYVLHGGIHPAASPAETDDLYAQQRDLLSSAGDEAAQRGLIIVVENLFVEPARATALPSRLTREIAGIAHPNVWACLDFSHGFTYSTALGANFAEEVAALAPFARHLHVHDSFGWPAVMPSRSRAERFAYGEGDLHLPPGLGGIPWDDLMRPLEYPGGLVFNLE